MRIYEDIDLKEFEPWAGATYTMETLTYSELDTLQDVIEEIYPDGLSTTDVNDILWFETDWIAELLGYEDWEALEEDRQND